MTLKPQTFTVGVISDTHGLLRDEALGLLNGSDAIIHGGDIGDPEILSRLRVIAPLTVVRGNNDTQSWADDLPKTAVLEAGGLRIFVLHSIAELTFTPIASDFHVVVSGHSHKPSVESRDGVLFINPGSAGPRRFSLPLSVARLTVRNGRAHAEIQLLPTQGARK